MEGLPVRLLSCAPTKRLSLIGIWRLAQWLKHQGVGAVHSHVYNAHVYSVLAAALAGIPSVIHHHKTFKRDKPLRFLILRLLSRLAAAQITLSENTRQQIVDALRIPDARVHVLENCVDTAVFHPAPSQEDARHKLGIEPNTLMLGSIASLNSTKNHFATIQMVSAIRSQHINVKAIICGQGNLRSALQEEIEKLQLQPHLRLLGNKRPIAPWLQILDLLVLPSTWEGQPLILLQAMACNIPIIASDIEGNVAALGADHPGLFDHTSTRHYTAKVKEFFTTTELRSRIADYQNQFLSQKHSLHSYSQQINHIYRTLDPELRKSH